MDPQWASKVIQSEYYGNCHYSYCANNPVVFVDSDGRIYETAWDVLSTIVDMSFALYYQLSGNTEADVSAISKIKLSYLDDVLSPEDFSKISHMERGRLNEKRFWPDKKYTNKIPSIVLKKEEHKQFTNRWRELYKYGSGYKITASNAADFLKESKRVYGDDAINEILKGFIDDSIEKGIIK